MKKNRSEKQSKWYDKLITALVVPIFLPVIPIAFVGLALWLLLP